MRYWLMADGDDGDQWNEFYRDGVVRITGKEGTFPGCHAICLADNHRLEPGTRAKDFRILTELKPGFTTGVAKHFLPYDIPPPPEVPYIVRSQLSQLGDLDKYFPTIGPRFAPDTLDSIMAADYLAGIRQLVETARLDARSEFVLELEGLLGRFQNVESRTIMPKATPHTEGALREQ